MRDGLNRAQALADEKLDELRQTIELKRKGDIASALALVETDQGRLVMDRLRQVIGGLQAEVGRRLEARRMQLDEQSAQLRLTTLVTIALIVVVALVLLLDARRRLNQLRETEHKLRDANEGLDREVAQRTAALRENEARYRNFFENAAVGCAELGLDQRFIRVNARLCQITGYSAEELVGERVSALSHPDDRPAADAQRARYLRGEMDHFRREARFIRKDGQMVWTQITAALVRDGAGAPAYSLGVIQDINERKLAEIALEAKEARFRTVLENSRDAIYRYDLQQKRFEYISPVAEVISGFSVDELMAQDSEQARALIHPDDRATVEAAFARLEETGAVEIEYRQMRKGGDYVWLSNNLSLTRDASGRPSYRNGNIRDITARKQADEALRDSEARLRAAQEALLDAFLIHEPIRDEAGRVVDLKVVYANPIAARFCRSTPENMIGRRLSEIIPGSRSPGGLIERHGRIIESGRTQDYVLDYDADGIKGHFRNVIAPFGRYAAVSFRDITREVEEVDALAAAKAEAERASEAKSKFLAAASHDLRQPVQSLTLLLAMIKRLVSDRPKAAASVEMAETALSSLSGLLTGILDISRLEAGVVTPQAASVDLAAVVKKLAAEYRPRAESAGLALRAVPGALWARTDAALLDRILRNLLENALRYTLKGGVLIALRRRGDKARIDVFDTGIGIPADKQAEIFVEFRQLGNPARDASQGLGLGLAIVSRLAHLLDTEVQVCSRPGHGSRFSISLPLDRAVAFAAPEPALPDPGGRILVIEDNAGLREAFAAMLDDWGYATMTAASGEEAFAVAEKEAWRFDAILADHRLGAGVTGAEAAREIARRAGRAFPTMIVTGDTAKERIAEIHASGFAMLHKPVEAKDLRRQVAQALTGC